MTVKLHKDTLTIGHAKDVLRGITKSCQFLKFATIITDDGFEVAHFSFDGTAHPQIASMSSSMQALGDAITRNLIIGGCEYIVIAAPKGYVIQLRVPGYPLVLGAYFDSGETVGKALAVARMAAVKMAGLPQPAST